MRSEINNSFKNAGLVAFGILAGLVAAKSCDTNESSVDLLEQRVAHLEKTINSEEVKHTDEKLIPLLTDIRGLLADNVGASNTCPIVIPSPSCNSVLPDHDSDDNRESTQPIWNTYTYNTYLNPTSDNEPEAPSPSSISTREDDHNDITTIKKQRQQKGGFYFALGATVPAMNLNLFTDKVAHKGTNTGDPLSMGISSYSLNVGYKRELAPKLTGKIEGQLMASKLTVIDEDGQATGLRALPRLGIRGELQRNIFNFNNISIAPRVWAGLNTGQQSTWSEGSLAITGAVDFAGFSPLDGTVGIGLDSNVDPFTLGLGLQRTQPLIPVSNPAIDNTFLPGSTAATINFGYSFK